MYGGVAEAHAHFTHLVHGSTFLLLQQACTREQLVRLQVPAQI
jgi:hypothetical protein